MISIVHGKSLRFIQQPDTSRKQPRQGVQNLTKKGDYFPGHSRPGLIEASRKNRPALRPRIFRGILAPASLKQDEFGPGNAISAKFSGAFSPRPH